MKFLLFTLNKYQSLVNTTIAYFEYFLLTKIVLPFEFRTNENNFNYSEFMANFAQWSKNIPSRRWRHKTVPVPCPFVGDAACLAFGLWQADNKYLQETPRPLISVKKPRTSEPHKMRARKQFIKVLLLNCRLCGCFR